MNLPLRVKQERIQTAGRVRSPAHLKWIRTHHCCVPGCKNVPIEAAHVRTGTDGGMGMKPSDSWSISLCAPHHHQQHNIGEADFERVYGIDMKALAAEFTSKSPHRSKFRRS